VAQINREFTGGPTSDARVSMPLDWDEVAGCDPAAFTLATAPARFAARGDASAGIDAAAGSLDGLLQLAAGRALSPEVPGPAPPGPCRARLDSPLGTRPSRGPSRRGPATAPLRPSLDREPPPAQDGSGSASDREADV
jgi:hypothetical protein